MTDAAPEKRPRETKRGGWFVNDAELIEILGVPEPIARQAFDVLDNDPRSGFPRKQKLWGDRRYWPAVQRYFDQRSGMIPGDAARLAAENRDHRTRPPRPPAPAVPLRRVSNDE